MISKLFQLGDPLEHRGVVIIPLFPQHDPVAAYLTLDEALRGFCVREVGEAGLVPELLVENPLAEDVLLYDGEELLGAKQNRILNVTVLVGGRSKLPIPVSCVEEGRWAARSVVLQLQPGQCGALLAVGEELCVDAVSRSAALTALWPKLRAGYLLDALDRLDRPAVGGAAVTAFVSAAPKATATRRPSPGRGDDVRLSGDGVLGSGLELDGELLQLSAFTAGGADIRAVGRIARPSRRRPA